jgi:hypothetical protein
MCEVQGCNREGSLLYKGKEICTPHWTAHCDEKKRFDLKTCKWKRGKK